MSHPPTHLASSSCGLRLRALLVSSAIAVAGSACAAEIARLYTFAAPAVALDAEGYARVTVAGADLYQPVGKPGIPFLADRIELPADATDVTLGTSIEAPATIPLPAPPAFGHLPVAVDAAGATRRGTPDGTVYGRDALWPAAPAELASLQREDGRLFAVVRVFPARVNPLARICESTAAVTVRLSYGRPTRRLAARAATAADNAWTYLLVTTNAFAQAFAPLAAHKAATGTPVHVLDMADILADYTGADAAEKLRNAIRDGYANHGTRYVLLGGGRTAVPFRKVYARMSDMASVTSLVSDLYFACLDGSWDGNGNGVYGEPTDGEGGGDVDLAADVYVGRAPANTAADAAHFVAKALAYATNAHANAASALLAGEYLGRYDVTDDTKTTYYAQGGNALDPLDECLRAYTSIWLDDRPQHRHVWNEQQAVAALNAAPNLVAHAGHGERTSCMNMTPARLRALTNAAPFLLNSIACHPGDFTTSAESIAEACLNASNAAFAAVLNTNYGWFDVAEEGLCSGEFMRTFLEHAVLRGAPLGVALQRGKADLLAKVETSGDDLVYRWCYFENTLFGDPQLTVQRPEALRAKIGGSASRLLVQGSSTGTVAPYHFTLFNAYDAETRWAVRASSPLFVPCPADGAFSVTDTNTVAVALAPEAAVLEPGTYTGGLVVSNLVTAATSAFNLALTVISPPVVTDSLGAANDGDIPFGTVTNGTLRAATVTIRNTDAATPLAIEAPSLAGQRLPAGLPRPEAFALYDQYNGYVRLLSPTNGFTETPLAYYYYFLGGLATATNAPGSLFGIDYERQEFVVFSLADGAFATRALPAPDGGMWSGLAYSPYHRQLFAAVSLPSGANANTTLLVVIDPDTPACVRLGRTEGLLAAIAFDRAGTLYGLDVAGDRLLALDLYSGAVLREITLDRDLQNSQGLDFDSAGRHLYATLRAANGDMCRLAALDVETGAVTEIATLSGKGEYELATLPAATPFAVDGAFPLTIAPGASATLRVSCEPVAKGSFTDTLGLHLPDSPGPFATLALSCDVRQPSRIDTAWLEAFGLACDGSDDLADTDGDGLANYEEWLCGTSPIDARDALVIDSATAGPDGFTLGWRAIPGLTYAVKSARAPGVPFEPLASITATNSTMSYTDTRAHSNAFYRVTLPAPPRQ